MNEPGIAQPRPAHSIQISSRDNTETGYQSSCEAKGAGQVPRPVMEQDLSNLAVEVQVEVAMYVRQESFS